MTSEHAETRLWKTVLSDPVHFLAFGFGTGLAPRAPGTVGSLPGVLLAWLALPLALEWRIALALALIVAGIWICGRSATKLTIHDHPGIVWDEIAGMYVTLLFVPFDLGLWALSFGLFRLFDIWKPWPIRDLDHRLAGGTGIMLDDLVAALYAAVLLGFGGGIIAN